MIRRLVSKADVLREYTKQRAEGMPAAQALKIAQYNCRMRASPFFHAHDGERVTYKGREFIVRMDYDSDAGERYVSVGLTLRGETEWLGGVEDDCAEYLAEVLTEHAEELLTQEAEDYRRETLRRAFC